MRRARLQAAAVAALTVGCGALNCQLPPDQTRDPADDSAAPLKTRNASDSADDPQGHPEAASPNLTPKAREARLAAQKSLLGRNLFEDLDGKPVPALDIGETEGEGEDFEDAWLDALPGSSGIALGGEEDNAQRANGNALGLYVPIEDPAEPALDAFHDALRALAEGKDADGKVRIAAYGGSHTQSDVYTGYMRTYLQSRFGNGGRGYLSMVELNGWWRYVDYSVESKDWFVEHAQKKDSRGDGQYGLVGGSGSASKSRAFARIAPKEDRADLHASNYELAYLAQPGGGKFNVIADGKKIDTIDTGAEAPHPAFHRFELPAGAHVIEVRPKGGAEVRMFGISVERDEPGIVVDTFGISGTRAANQLAWDEASWAEQIRRRDPKLYTLFFGTNEATDSHQPMETYRANLEAVLDRFERALPEASCLLIGPGDFPRKLDEQTWVPRPRAIQILEVQRDVAYEHGCGFWDTTAFMGGVGSMHTWATSRPQMGGRDHIHFTRRGYVRLGMALTDAIMARFDAD